MKARKQKGIVVKNIFWKIEIIICHVKKLTTRSGIMKVGIVTLFDNTNFGNRLQNYAVQEILKHYADEVVTIKNKSMPHNWKERILRTLPLAESVLVNYLFGKKRKAAILSFSNKYINTSLKCYYFDKSYNILPEQCDYYCAGSDQIWNPALGRTGGFNYLDFSKREKNFSLSASFGISNISKSFEKYVRNGLSHIGKISVREDAGATIIKNLDGRDGVEVLIDPTLYLSVDEWSTIMKKPKAYNEEVNYMLLYFLGNISESRMRGISKFAIDHGLKIIDIMKNDSKYYNIGPDEFIFMIKHATYVCTDSFHASVFSFLFDTPLGIYMREDTGENMSSRLETLANKFGLRQQFIIDNEINDKALDIDYRKGKEILNIERRKVNNFLDAVFALR